MLLKSSLSASADLDDLNSGICTVGPEAMRLAPFEFEPSG